MGIDPDLRYLSQPITSQQNSQSCRKLSVSRPFSQQQNGEIYARFTPARAQLRATQVNIRRLTGQPASKVNCASIFGREMDRRCCWVQNTLVR